MKKLIIYAICLILGLAAVPAQAQKLLIPMDLTQTDHLKAYGVAYWVLTFGQNVEWLLNYRGGSFLTDDSSQLEQLCNLRGVKFEIVSGGQEAQIKATIDENNMDMRISPVSMANSTGRIATPTGISRARRSMRPQRANWDSRKCRN
jgi:hypothetical protein